MKREAKLRMMTSTEIRASFLEFFRKNGHTVVPSSSLVPGNDPTLLFTNAGMVQFKDVFLGKDVREYSRAASSQRCVRAGGKHNDLENVGYTARHHTFFEMLGNFSFGDYFKREAIHFAWNFITGTLGIPKDRLWVTVFREDDEAERVWTEEIGIDPTRCTRMGEKSNFWSMGETGPCGPCTRFSTITAPRFPAARPARRTRTATAMSRSGISCSCSTTAPPTAVLTPLPKPSVDTGMGLERVAAVMQGVHSNYDIDLFNSLDPGRRRGHRRDGSGIVEPARDRRPHPRLHVPDHRRRRALERGPRLRPAAHHPPRHPPRLQAGPDSAVLPQAGAASGARDGRLLLRSSSAARRARRKSWHRRRMRFAETLETGMALLDAATAELTSSVIPGETVFKLYDTYGFPARSDRRRGPRARAHHRSGGVRCGDGRAAGRRAGREQVRRRITAKSVKLDGKTEFSGYDRSRRHRPSSPL